MAAMQCRPSAPDPLERNLELIEGGLRQAEADGAHLAVFPEVTLSGHVTDPEAVRARALALDNSLVRKAIALTDSIPSMLAWANDASYEEIFVEQLKNLMEPGDVVIGISGSGNSMNVIKAIEEKRTFFVKPLNDHIKRINAEFNSRKKIAEELKDIISGKILTYQEAEEKRLINLMGG